MSLIPTLLSSFYYFYFSIIGVYIIFMPKVLADIGYNASEIGIIFSASPLVRFILPFLFMNGLKLDKKIFNFALLMILFSSLSFFLSIHNFYLLLCSNIFLGIGLSLTLPYIETISLATIGKQRYGKVRLFGSIGFVVIALILVKFLDNPYNALWFLTTLSLITISFAYFIIKFSHKDESISKKEKNHIDILKDYKLWLSLILMQMSFGSFYNFFTIYETDYGISLDMTIYLWSFGVLVEIVMLFFQGRLLNSNLLNVIQFTTFSTVIRWFLVFYFPQNLPLLFLSQSLHALSFALFHSASISYLHQKYKQKTLAQQLFSGITYGLGGLSGALISGYIYEIYPKYLFLSSSFIAFVSFIFIYLYAKENS